MFICKMYILILASIVILCTNILPLTAQQNEEKKLPTAAVLDFAALAGISKPAAAALTSKFRHYLSKTNVYNLLDRSDMEEILKEQAFTLTGVCNSAECAIEIGQLLSAEKIITGDIGKIGQTYTFTAKVIDVTTGKIDRSESDEYKGEVEGLLYIFEVLAQKVAGTYKKSNIWWYVGGAAVVGAAVTTAIILNQKEEPGETRKFPLPPSPPNE